MPVLREAIGRRSRQKWVEVVGMLAHGLRELGLKESMVEMAAGCDGKREERFV